MFSIYYTYDRTKKDIKFRKRKVNKFKFIFG